MASLVPAPPPRPRLALVDVLRGVAIVAMVVYHFAWDLAYFGYLDDITQDLRWIWFQRAILGSFLVLVGISLVLGHGDGIRWRGFWRRWLVLVAAALAMSVATWLAFGEAFAFFGILHAIALFSLLALPFLRLPPWLTAAAGVAVVALGATVKLPGFGERWLAWIGFWSVPPWTADLVSVFPWFGAVLLGMAVGRMLPWTRWTWTPAGPLTRTLRLMGRWSLLIYLLHQPLLLAVLYPLSLQLPPSSTVVVGAPRDPAAFLAQCRPSCESGGAPAGYCTAYCACALEQVEAGDLWDAVGAAVPTPTQQAEAEGIIGLCSAMAETPAAR